jgi:hypothetical protein
MLGAPEQGKIDPSGEGYERSNLGVAMPNRAQRGPLRHPAEVAPPGSALALREVTGWGTKPASITW